jgi:hypothetical protein
MAWKCDNPHKNAPRGSHAGTPEGKLVVVHPARRSALLAGQAESESVHFRQLARTPLTGRASPERLAGRSGSGPWKRGLRQCHQPHQTQAKPGAIFPAVSSLRSWSVSADGDPGWPGLRHGASTACLPGFKISPEKAAEALDPPPVAHAVDANLLCHSGKRPLNLLAVSIQAPLCNCRMVSRTIGNRLPYRPRGAFWRNVWKQCRACCFCPDLL